jgi:gliding motility-associated lipoprotein GldD
MFPKIDFPEKSYQQFNEDYCQVLFEYPTYAQVVQDSLFFGEKTEHPCWFDLIIPSLNGKIHCSYQSIQSTEDFEELVNDAFTFSSKHTQKADYRDELVIEKPNNVSGIIFEMSGEVATPVHFFLTDSIQHYFRASVYFYNQVNPDSMAPVHEFIKEDVAKMIETFEWKN